MAPQASARPSEARPAKPQSIQVKRYQLLTDEADFNNTLALGA